MSSQLRAVQKKRKEREEPGAQAEPNLADGRLLAGYLAHEFLTRGTLLGKKWEPARPGLANAVQPLTKAGSSKPGKPYAEVSTLLMNPDGAHIPGVVNPTQLGRWLQM